MSSAIANDGASTVWRTIAYKTVEELQIRADVRGSAGGKPRPVVVWLHGGALINGHRESVPRWVEEACQSCRYVLVSLDYRLAPETQLPEIVRDVEDAFQWIRASGPELFNADPRRIAVVGGSAGGYLTLTSGFRVSPVPTALVSLWGYGDLVGPWYSRPSPHPRHLTVKVSSEEAWRQVSGPPISDARQRKGDGGAFYKYCRQTGSWPKAVSGWDPIEEAAKFFPYMAVKNVTPDYPPTLLIHGENDTDVPFEQSELMAAEFKKHGVPHRLIRIAAAEHGLAGADPRVVDEAYRQAAAFLRDRLDEHG